MPQLHNVADVTGQYDGVGVENTTELFVELSALEIEKRANKTIWVKDQLEYTITVTNIDENLQVTLIEVTDNIDPDIATLDMGSVELTINGVPQTPVDFDFTNGTLTVNIPVLDPLAVAVITFCVDFV